MKRILHSQVFLGIFGGIIGAIAMIAVFLTISSVIAAPSAFPPDGNPTFPSAGLEGPPGPAGPAGAPVGSVVFYDGAACPDGWTEVIDARGRYIVGLNGGTSGSVIGSSLSNGENRTVGQHNHSASGLSFSGTAVDPHTHVMKYEAKPDNPGSGGPMQLFADYPGTIQTDISTQSGGGHTPAGSITGSTADSGTIAGTNAPYIQFLLCKYGG